MVENSVLDLKAKHLFSVHGCVEKQFCGKVHRKVPNVFTCMEYFNLNSLKIEQLSKKLAYWCDKPSTPSPVHDGPVYNIQVNAASEYGKVILHK